MKILIICTAAFLFGGAGIHQHNRWSEQQPVVEVSAMSVESQAITPTTEYQPPAIRDNQRVVLQVNDWLSVQAICADGSPASVDKTDPTVVFVCE